MLLRDCAHSTPVLVRSDPIVALLFQFERELFSTLTRYLTVRENMHKVRNNVIQQTLVVSHNDDCVFRGAQLIYPTRYDTQRVNIQS